MSDGLAAVFRNLLQVFGAVVVGVVAYFVSICTCLGWIAILPVLMWGMYRFLLDLVDGRAEVSALWSGTRAFGHSFGSMWGIVLLYLVIMLPMIGAMGVLSVLGGALIPLGIDAGFGKLDPITSSVLSLVVTTIYGFLVVRFVFAPFLVVDRKTAVLDAFRDTWRATGPVWGKLVLLQLLLVLLNLPAQALAVGIQILNANAAQDPAVALDQMGTMFAMGAGLYVLLGIGGVIGMAIMAAAYRQMFGNTD